MASAALDSLRQTIEDINQNQDQYSISRHHKHHIRSILGKVISLQECFEGFPEEANNLEGRTKDVANEAQEYINGLISKQTRQPFITLNRCIGLLAKFGKCKINFLQKIKEEMDSIAGEVMEMAKKGNLYEESRHSFNPAIGSSFSTATSSSSVLALTMAINIKDADDLDDDVVAIKSRLCGGSMELQVIPVVGMGGIGKTTLARYVYDDPLTIHYFDVRAWVTVSQDYSTQKIVSSLMESMKDFVTKRSGQREEETVYRSLKGRRYLVVMDDMWSTNAWDDVRNLFPNDSNGSRILSTTRLRDVAAYSGSHSALHEMRFMSREQSWDLLRRRVFADRECSSELEDIGKKIAESCGGLPLAIVVIAGLLSTVGNHLGSWQEIASNVSSIVVNKDGQFEEILSLSYTHLPHHLRPCFLYMGGFPEDHETRVSKLVKLWIAEGFLRLSEGSSKSLEDEAEECLEDLVSRTLVLVTKRKSNGKIKSCRLHDLIRDLCIRKAQESNFLLNLVGSYVEKEHLVESMKDQNRVSVKSSSLKYLSSTNCSTIHTIMCFHKHLRVKLDFLNSVKLLRVLDAENADVESLPDELFELYHLRYLALYSTSGFVIPAAVSKLQNLQTLINDARNRWKLKRRHVVCLPPEIWLMPQLRHLICRSNLPDPDVTTPTLENLQTLSLVSHDICFEGALEKIPNIKKLGIDCSYYQGTHLNNLLYMHQLESLKLCNGNWRKGSICFPRMLRKLSLCNMWFPWGEMGIVGSLPNLEVLKLRDFACTGSTWETSQGGFPQLQFLLIEYSMLRHWITESNHFPRLKFLLLHQCHLDKIPDGIGEITTLELIDIRGNTYNRVPKSLAESAIRIQEEQRSLGNDALQVHCPLSKENIDSSESRRHLKGMDKVEEAAAGDNYYKLGRFC